MFGSRRLARLAAALAAALTTALMTGLTLLVVPLTLDTAAAEPCVATATQACASDVDGDGIPDASDGCPTTFSTTPTGCPTASRRASLEWVASKKVLEARVTSPVSACSRRARIVLWRVRPNRDFKLLGVTASSRGRYRFTVPRGARYYVTVSPSYASGQAECAQATSRTVLAARD